MHINLQCDIPKEYNDMSKGEIAKLSMELKKLVGELNFYLNRLDRENFSEEYNDSCDKRLVEITAKLDLIEERMSKLEGVQDV